MDVLNGPSFSLCYRSLGLMRSGSHGLCNVSQWLPIPFNSIGTVLVIYLHLEVSDRKTLFLPTFFF